MTIADGLKGHLTATVHGTEEDLREYKPLLDVLGQKVGRLIINAFPTGVELVTPCSTGTLSRRHRFPYNVRRNGGHQPVGQTPLLPGLSG